MAFLDAPQREDLAGVIGIGEHEWAVNFSLFSFPHRIPEVLVRHFIHGMYVIARGENWEEENGGCRGRTGGLVFQTIFLAMAVAVGVCCEHD